MADAADAQRKADAIQIYIPTHLIVIPLCASALGFLSGLSTSGSLASLQFTAENAHRQPTTMRGWYFYQKTKNYKVLWAGAKGGLKKGGLLGGGTALFLGLAEALDENLKLDFEGHKAASGSLSGAVLAFAMSKLYKLGRGTTRRTLLGAGLGALAGGLQDLKRELDRRKPELAQEAKLV